MEPANCRTVLTQVKNQLSEKPQFKARQARGNAFLLPRAFLNRTLSEMAGSERPAYQVSVRQLVEFSLRTGDLGGERDFVGAHRALAGIRGHQKIQRSRPEGYQKELPLSHELIQDEFTLRIRGRLDGLLVAGDEVVVEEIKTVQGSWDEQPDPLHWAQGKIYGFIYGREKQLASITLQLTYLRLDTGEVLEFRERYTLDELFFFFQKTTAVYLAWVADRHQWYKKRDASIRAMAFPFEHYRPGQRKLAVAAYRTLAIGGRLFLEAPTGIGKTLSVVFPAVKALGERKLERIFYLTARTVGRNVAEKAFRVLRKAGLKLCTLTLTARDRICAQGEETCDPQNCPLAHGYYDRCKAAMRQALEAEELTRPMLEAISREHKVCPFELSLDLSVWVDAVICDYNYVFDPKVYLRRHFSEENGEHAFLIDEAHNLVDRAREMFSASLGEQQLNFTRRALKGALPRCAKTLGKLTSALRKLGGTPSKADPTRELPSDEPDLFSLSARASSAKHALAIPLSSAQKRDNESARRELPEEFVGLVQDALRQAEAWLSRNEPAPFRESLLETYFQLNSFARTAQLYDERYVAIASGGAEARLRLFCLDPSFLLRQALLRGKAAVFFSATLTPVQYYRELLGGMPEDPLLQLASPFPPENLGVFLQPSIRTHLKARDGTLPEVVDAISSLIQARRGNYLVYLPSYQYLTAVHDRFKSLHPECLVYAQRPAMTEQERDLFLAAFTTDHQKTLVGFAVLGGVFGEGIDLIGEHLIGVVIVGVGLPQLCLERDLLRSYFDARTGNGFEYAYTFPGLNRVLQATGRVIRSETDTGVVLLIDARFTERRYLSLLPTSWQLAQAKSSAEIATLAGGFWTRAKKKADVMASA